MFEYMYIWDEVEEKVKAIHRAQVQSWPYSVRELGLKSRGWTQKAAGAAGTSKLPLSHHKWSDHLKAVSAELVWGYVEVIWGGWMCSLGEWERELEGHEQDCQEAPSVGLRLTVQRLPSLAVLKDLAETVEDAPGEGSGYEEAENTTLTHQLSI